MVCVIAAHIVGKNMVHINIPLLTLSLRAVTVHEDTTIVSRKSLEQYALSATHHVCTSYCGSMLNDGEKLST